MGHGDGGYGALHDFRDRYLAEDSACDGNNQVLKVTSPMFYFLFKKNLKKVEHRKVFGLADQKYYLKALQKLEGSSKVIWWHVCLLP